MARERGALRGGKGLPPSPPPDFLILLSKATPRNLLPPPTTVPRGRGERASPVGERLALCQQTIPRHLFPPLGLGGNYWTTRVTSREWEVGRGARLQARAHTTHTQLLHGTSPSPFWFFNCCQGSSTQKKERMTSRAGRPTPGK